MNKQIKLALVGATGLVGQTALKVLEEKNIPNVVYTLFASSRSAGEKITFLNKEYVVKELTTSSFDEGFDFALFTAGGEISKSYAPIAVNNGCTVIDNSSAFRMDESIPLVVPEVNKQDLVKSKGIIANPNCSTIQAMVALKPLDDKYTLKRVVFSTYQAVSGAGKSGIDDLENGIKGLAPSKFPYPIFNNCLPHIDSFLENGYTKEEMKMINETRKILHKPDLNITATTVRVPVINCHSESINLEFEKDFDINELKQVLKNAPGIVLEDDISNNIYPLATNANNKNEVFVGRIRRDESIPYGINLWVVADNVRKGAATNAIQILEELLKEV